VTTQFGVAVSFFGAIWNSVGFDNIVAEGLSQHRKPDIILNRLGLKFITAKGIRR